MAKILYITQEIIQNTELAELDMDLDNKLGFYESDEDSDGYDGLETLHKGEMAEVTNDQLEIDVAINLFQEMKAKGATHVAIDHHCDHHGYLFTASNIRLSTQDEIDAFKLNTSMRDHYALAAEIRETEAKLNNLKAQYNK